MKNKTLSDFAFYVSEKCDSIIANKNNYIGTDNMLPNYGGIIESEYLPNTSKVNIYKKDDILISNIRPYFKKIWRADCDGTCSSDVLVIRAKNNITSSLLYYYLSRDVFFDYVTKGSSGSKMPRGNKNHIMKFPMNNISELDGNKIVNLIENIDKRIKNNKVILTNLENLGELLFNYWFLQFDFSDENGKPYKSSGGKMEYSKELNREIPEGWEVKTLYKNSLCKIIKTGIDDFESKNFLTTSNIIGTQVTDGEWINYDSRPSRANMQPTENSVWFAKMKNSYKHLYLSDNCDYTIDKYIISTGMLGLKCNQNAFSYIASYIQNKNFEKRKDMVATGATQEAINNEDLKFFNIVIPDNSTLNKFDDLTRNLFRLRDGIFEENQQLNELKDWLLPMLMNGQVKINGK